MAKKIILFSLLFGISIQVYSQDKNRINSTDLREKATNYALNAVEAYNNFYSSGEKSYLINATKYASMSTVLFDIYIEVEDISKDSDLILINKQLSQLSADYPKELITIPSGSFRVTSDNVQANNDYTARLLMASITTTKILKRWLEGNK